MGASGKYYLVTILFLFFSFSIDSGKADICYDSDDYPEKTCPDSFSFSDTYCCGSSGYYYCCDYDAYNTYTNVADSISTAIIVAIVISIIIVVAIVVGIIACCVCGCVCCAKATNTTSPVTRTYVTTQPAQQSQVVVHQAYPPPQGGYPPQQAAYPHAGGAYPPPAYLPTAEGEKPPSYPI